MLNRATFSSLLAADWSRQTAFQSHFRSTESVSFLTKPVEMQMSSQMKINHSRGLAKPPRR
jgi:hypothetical protein